MYPFNNDYIPIIEAFIKRLNANPEIKVVTNCMSTQLFGPYDVVMPFLTNAIKIAGEQNPNVIFSLKVIPQELSL